MTIEEGLSQSELRSIAETKAHFSGHVSLMAIRPRDDQRMLALVVAHDAYEALDHIRAEGVEWGIGQIWVNIVHRNVDQPRGLVTWIPLRRHEGQHRVHIRPGQKANKHRKRLKRLCSNEQPGTAATDTKAGENG